MKAARLHGRQDLRVENVEEMSLAPGEVRVRIEAALTCGTDVKVWRRGYHARMLTPPCRFGHEFAGVISEVHPQTPGWSLGERVVAANSAPCGDCDFCQRGQEQLCRDLLFLNGAYAESIVVPARIVRCNLLRLGAGTSFRDAALVEPLACVVQGLDQLRVHPGERVLVIGSGPIGLMATALVIGSGADAVVAGRGTARLAAARRLGARAVVESAAHDDVEWAVKSALERTEFDAVFEAVGKPETWAAAVRLVRPGGRVNWFGGCPSGSSVMLDTTWVHYSALTLFASFHHTPRTIRRA
ncbi:MAG TPA: alcohol dehydrogenase, partial [Verrucomicrobiales bacterium]|nr:alcohol dehydrogenase [Verrucomicrobiales bacterium]